MAEILDGSSEIITDGAGSSLGDAGPLVLEVQSANHDVISDRVTIGYLATLDVHEANHSTVSDLLVLLQVAVLGVVAANHVVNSQLITLLSLIELKTEGSSYSTTKQTAASNDDGRSVGGSWLATTTSDQFGNVNIFGTASSALRFITTIPQGAIIKTAYLSLYIANMQSGMLALCYGIDEDNTATFSADPFGRDKTIAYTTCNYADWSEASGWSNGPSLVNIIQEIVDRAGFGGAIGFFLEDNSSPSSNACSYYTYDYGGGGSGNQPKLYVEWTESNCNHAVNSEVVEITASIGLLVHEPNHSVVSDKINNTYLAGLIVREANQVVVDDSIDIGKNCILFPIAANHANLTDIPNPTYISSEAIKDADDSPITDGAGDAITDASGGLRVHSSGNIKQIKSDKPALSQIATLIIHEPNHSIVGEIISPAITYGLSVHETIHVNVTLQKVVRTLIFRNKGRIVFIENVFHKVIGLGRTVESVKVHSCNHNVVSDHPNFAYLQNLVPHEADHAVVGDKLTLLHNKGLIVHAANHNTIANASILGIATSITTVQAPNHNTISDKVKPSPGEVLIIHDSVLAIASDVKTLPRRYSFVVGNPNHAQQSERFIVSRLRPVVVQEVQHVQKTDHLLVTNAQLIVVHSIIHAINAVKLELGQTLTIHSPIHVQNAQKANLTQIITARDSYLAAVDDVFKIRRLRPLVSKDTHHNVAYDIKTPIRNTTATVHDLYHSILSDMSTLTFAANLTIKGSNHNQVVITFEIFTGQLLSPISSVLRNFSDVSKLSQYSILSVKNPNNVIKSDIAELARKLSLVLTETIHNQIPDVLTIQRLRTLVVYDCNQTQLTDKITVDIDRGLIVISPANVVSSQTIDTTQSFVLSVFDANHNHIADLATTSNALTLSVLDGHLNNYTDYVRTIAALQYAVYIFQARASPYFNSAKDRNYYYIAKAA